jgi:hypothetical protein
MLMRRLLDDLGGVMIVRRRHRRVDRMSRVFCAGGLAHVGGKRSADDHESECEDQQAPSHPSPSISNPIATAPSMPDEFLFITEASQT